MPGYFIWLDDSTLRYARATISFLILVAAKTNIVTVS